MNDSMKIMFDELNKQKQDLMDLTRRFVALNDQYNKLVVDRRETNYPADYWDMKRDNEKLKGDLKKVIEDNYKEMRRFHIKYFDFEMKLRAAESSNKFIKKDLELERMTTRELIAQRNALGKRLDAEVLERKLIEKVEK